MGEGSPSPGRAAASFLDVLAEDGQEEHVPEDVTPARACAGSAMTTSEILIFARAFLASAVEMVGSRSTRCASSSARCCSRSGPPKGRCGLAGRRSRAPRCDRLLVAALVRARAGAAAPADEARARGGEGVKFVRAFGRFWWNFIVGDHEVLDRRAAADRVRGTGDSDWSGRGLPAFGRCGLDEEPPDQREPHAGSRSRGSPGGSLSPAAPSGSARRSSAWPADA
jgi:hypothetical protein